MHSKWFDAVRSEFCSRVAPFAGKPVTYVEIGVWHGACATWVCENILTHHDSHGVGIDPYAAVGRHPAENMERIKQEAITHLEPFKNWTWIFNDSKKVFRRWRRSIDILYIDGEHEAPYVLQDFVLAIPHMRQGGVIIFDDFSIGLRKRVPCVPEAVAAILMTFEGMLEPLPGNEKQFAFQVTTPEKEEWRAKMRGRVHNPKHSLSTIKHFCTEALNENVE